MSVGSEGSGMGGSRMRRSSNVVLSESRRFCSAALWEVLRTWRGGCWDEDEDEEGVADRGGGGRGPRWYRSQ